MLVVWQRRPGGPTTVPGTHRLEVMRGLDQIAGLIERLAGLDPLRCWGNHRHRDRGGEDEASGRGRAEGRRTKASKRSLCPSLSIRRVKTWWRGETRGAGCKHLTWRGGRGLRVASR